MVSFLLYVLGMFLLWSDGEENGAHFDFEWYDYLIYPAWPLIAVVMVVTMAWEKLRG